MQTVYILKNCTKSYKALLKLYTSPDLSTNIIIVDAVQARLLLLDRRVNKFPFIINTMPTNIGLIPKIASVLPLEMFIKLKDENELINRTNRQDRNLQEHKRMVYNQEYVPKYKQSSGNNFNFPAGKSSNLYSLSRTYSHRGNLPISNRHIYNSGIRNYYGKNNKTHLKNKKPIIKTVKETDGSVNIILN